MIELGKISGIGEGSLPAKSRADPVKNDSADKGVGDGQRRGGRQPGQLHSFSEKTSENRGKRRPYPDGPRDRIPS